MIRYNLFIFGILISCLAFTACSDDDGPDREMEIIGNWKMVDFNSTDINTTTSQNSVLGETTSVIRTDIVLLSGELLWSFEETKDFTVSGSWEGRTTQMLDQDVLSETFETNQPQNTTGTYTVNGSEITLVDGSSIDSKFEITVLDQENMTWVLDVTRETSTDNSTSVRHELVTFDFERE